MWQNLFKDIILRTRNFKIREKYKTLFSVFVLFCFVFQIEGCGEGVKINVIFKKISQKYGPSKVLYNASRFQDSKIHIG